MEKRPALSLAVYAAFREELLSRIHTRLESDQSCAAAWLAGSYGRGEQDHVSDLDLFVVVRDEYAVLCERQAVAASGAPPERLALFNLFGVPVNIHENHSNAPANGSFSAVLYHQPPVIVDWVMMPQTGAARPYATRLMFDKVGVRLQGCERAAAQEMARSEPVAQTSAEVLAERVAFFSMMSAVTAKYIIRGSRVEDLLTFTEAVAREIETLSGRQSPAASERVFANRQAQALFLRQLMDRAEKAVDNQMDQLRIPRQEIETILNLQP